MAIPIKETERKGKAVAKMFAVFGQSSDGERMALYVDLLKDIPTDVLETACRKASMESSYLPTVAELIKSSKDLVAEANGTKAVPFPEAWEEILKVLGETYVWDVPQFSHTEIQQLVNAFGWEELRMMETKDIPIIRSQLKGMYEAICQRNEEKAMNGYLLGKNKLIGSETRLLE